MSSISSVQAICSANSITISADFYISDNSDYRVDMTLYTMNGEVVKTGYYSWNDWSGAPGTRNFKLIPDYSLSATTQYYYEVQLSRRDSGTVLDRRTGYAATKLAHFEWDAPKRQGEDVNITANEWNRLWDKCIAEVTYVREWNFNSNLR